MHECRTARTLHDATAAHIFKTTSQKKLPVLGRDVLTSSNLGQDTGYSELLLPYPAQFITPDNPAI